MKDKDVVEDGIHMPKGKCKIFNGEDDELFRRQIDELTSNDRKVVADFRRLLRKKAKVRREVK